MLHRQSFERIMVLPPRLELGSRTNLVLPGYKPGALPIELREPGLKYQWVRSESNRDHLD